MIAIERGSGGEAVVTLPRRPDQVRDQRIEQIVPLLTPAEILDEQPLSPEQVEVVLRGRSEIGSILDHEADRLLVVVGPCSVHDLDAAREYAGRLAEAAGELRDDLCIAMRVYFEKPRTTTGWKGMINDPHLDGSGDVNSGLRIARGLLLEVLGLGLPVGCEFLDPIIPQYISDAVSWGAIGARTTESQTHRQLGSGLSMPVGFKNRTDGNVQVAVDAVLSAAVPHAFTGVDESGRPAILYTTGNLDCHVILRGGRDTPNYPASAVEDALQQLRSARLPERLVIDASHDNSGKDHTPPAGRGRRRRRPGGGRQRRDRGSDAGVLPGRRAPGDRHRRRARLRAVDHRRVHGLGHHRRRARGAGPGGAGAARRMRIAVLGVGLIGGSVGLAAKRFVPGAEVVGFGRDRGRLERARELGAVDAVASSLEEALQGAAACFACAPVGALPDQVEAALAAAPDVLRGHRRRLDQAAAGRADRRPALRGRPPDRRRGDERGGERAGRAVPGSGLVPHAQPSAPRACSTSAFTAS